MSFANYTMTPSHQLALRASDAAEAFTALGPRGSQATARAKKPGEVEKEARARVVQLGKYQEDTLKDLYDSKDKERQIYVKWLRRKTPQPGSSMDVAMKYILGRDKERSAEAAATPPPPASSSTSSGPSKAAASTVLPPRKPTAPSFSALVRGRPMGPGHGLQFQVAQAGQIKTPSPAGVVVDNTDDDESDSHSTHISLSTSVTTVTPFTLAKRSELTQEKVEEIHRAVTKFVVKGLHPFATVESPFFR
ncbi:unnamed protein product [Boreogadus saida]